MDEFFAQLTNIQSLSDLYWLQPWVIGAALAFAAYFLLSLIPWSRLGSQDRMASYSGGGTGPKAIDVGSPAHRVRLAFMTYGLDVAGWETSALWLARIGIGVAAGLALVLVVGLPPLVGLVGLGMGWLITDGLVAGAWRKMARDIEKEVPTCLVRLASIVQVTPNAMAALTEVCETLSERSPLRIWLARLLARMQQEGRTGFDVMLTEAQVINPGLGLAVFEIGRLWETGGEGYAAAFALASDNLSQVLQGRGLGHAKAEGVMGGVGIVILCLLGVSAVYLRAPQFGPVMQQPMVQLLYAGVALWMTYGWVFIQGMVEEALQ